MTDQERIEALESRISTLESKIRHLAVQTVLALLAGAFSVFSLGGKVEGWW